MSFWAWGGGHWGQVQPEALGKGSPFGVRKHKIKQNPGNTTRSASKHPELGDHRHGRMGM